MNDNQREFFEELLIELNSSKTIEPFRPPTTRSGTATTDSTASTDNGGVVVVDFARCLQKLNADEYETATELVQDVEEMLAKAKQSSTGNSTQYKQLVDLETTVQQRLKANPSMTADPLDIPLLADVAPRTPTPIAKHARKRKHNSSERGGTQQGKGSSSRESSVSRESGSSTRRRGRPRGSTRKNRKKTTTTTTTTTTATTTTTTTTITTTAAAAAAAATATIASNGADDSDNESISTTSSLQNDRLRRTRKTRGNDDNFRAASANSGSMTNLSNAGERLGMPEEANLLFAVVYTATDDDDEENERDISTMFHLLPSRVKYPEYYLVTKEPIDMRMIARRIQQGAYSTLDQCTKDFMLLVKNARNFNEPGSVIYQDAGRIKNLVQQTRTLIESGRHSEVMEQSRRSAGSLRNFDPLDLVNECAVINVDDDADDEMEVDSPSRSSQPLDEFDMSSEDEEETALMAPRPQNIFMQLWVTVHESVGPNGQRLCQGFMKLPHRKKYSDYYEEIKFPISLEIIRNRIYKNFYQNIGELANELERMCDNAIEYNVEGSQLHESAKLIKKVVKDEVSRIEAEPEGADSESGEPPSSAASAVSSKRPRKHCSYRDQLRRRLITLFKAVASCKDGDRSMVEIFEHLPDRTIYPDYYQVIPQPIDMTRIKSNIQSNEYANEQQLIEDFLLMFKNAKTYNEEGSQVYRDAEALEAYLKDRWSKMTPLSPDPASMDKAKAAGTTFHRQPGSSAGPLKTRSTNVVYEMTKKLQQIFQAITDFKDNRGRVLCTPYMKLPLKSDYPDYYEVIRRPIDLQRIQRKVHAGKYESVDDFMSDVNLVFDNACRYNEPDSLIYKDALVLQRVALDRKRQLTEEEPDAAKVPDVQAEVQEILLSLFAAVYEHKDELDRSFVDSFHENLLQEGADKLTPNQLTFDKIKRNLQKGRYKRLDRFQQDMFSILDGARAASRSESQLYEDACELKSCFIGTRDRLCENGKRLWSPALNYTKETFEEELNAERQERAEAEAEADTSGDWTADGNNGDGSRRSETNLTGTAAGESMRFRETEFFVGDFVYVEPKEKKCEPHVVCIERLWAESDGQPFLSGILFFRPNETFHVATRKFLEKEVFLTSQREENVPLSKVMGKCFVMLYRDYLKLRPDDYADADVYVCESKYLVRQKLFKKLTQNMWQLPDKPAQIRLVERDEELLPQRVASVFAEQNADDSDDSKEPLDVARPNVPLSRPLQSSSSTADDSVLSPPPPLTPSSSSAPPAAAPSLPPATPVETDSTEKPTPGEPELIYYEQYNITTGCYKLGDFVYVRSGEPLPFIGRIDKIWTDKNGQVLYRGPWLVRPSEIDHLPTRMFYPNELFLSSIEDTNPLLSVMKKCCVMDPQHYTTQRPTNLREEDVYVCESRYNETEKQIRRLARGLRTFSHSAEVAAEEIYYFRKPIHLHKEASPLLRQSNQAQGQMQPAAVPPVAGPPGMPPQMPPPPPGTAGYMPPQQGGWMPQQGGQVYQQPGGPPVFGHYIQITAPGGQGTILMPAVRPMYPPGHPAAGGPGQPTAAFMPVHQRPAMMAVTSQHQQQQQQQHQQLQQQQQQQHPPLAPPPPPAAGQPAPGQPAPGQPVQYGVPPQPYTPLAVSSSSSVLADGSPASVDAPTAFKKRPEPSANAQQQAQLDERARKLAKLKRSQTSGYILFCKERRNKVTLENPNLDFAEISRIMGQIWKDLPAEEKKVFDENARLENQERKRQAQAFEAELQAQRANMAPASPTSSRGQSPMSQRSATPAASQAAPSWQPPASSNSGPMAISNVVQLPNGQQVVIYPQTATSSAPPAVAGQPMLPSNAVINHQPAAVKLDASIQTDDDADPSSHPLFVAIPPRSQLVEHSQIYLKYLDNIRTGGRHQSDWMDVTQARPPTTAPAARTSTTPAAMAKPARWLKHGVDRHENLTMALWSLREHMLNDALSIRANVLQFDQL